MNARNGNGVVAAGHPVTAQAAATILNEGGNAFDAALAAMATACVAEPVLCSLGGGGFLMAAPAGGKPVLYDFFAHTPRRRPPEGGGDFYPILCDFGTAQQEFHIGMASIAAPGCVKALFRISHELGRMPVKRIVEPALAAARNGVTLNRLQAYIFQVVGGIYLSLPESRRIFCSGKDPERLVGEGEAFLNPAYADALDSLALEGEDLFYKGEISALIDRDSRDDGGAIRRDDLEGYEMVRRPPLGTVYRNAQILTNPPPSSGGLLIAFGLELLNEDVAEAFGSPSQLSRLAAVLEATQRARVESRLSTAAAETAADLILNAEFLDTYRRQVSGHPLMSRGTTHVSVIDGEGNAAAMTLSNGEGCGYIVPGTGIMLNNMLGEEDLNPAGFHAWAPDSRMSSMMAPTLISEENGAQLTALGSGGSNRIRTAILQVLVDLLDHRMELADAIEAPRLHLEGDDLDVEPGFPEDAVRALTDIFPAHRIWEDVNLFFGGVHAVRRDPRRGAHGAGDSRRGGCVITV